MKEIISVWVPGHPRTKGSLTGGRTGAGGVRLADSTLSRQWRAAICDVLVPEITDPVVKRGKTWRQLRPGWPRRDVPIAVSAWFWFERPVLGRGAEPIGRQYGDLDKLVRNVLDALQDSGVYADDAQVQRLMEVGKSFCGFGEHSRGEGAQITVWEMS